MGHDAAREEHVGYLIQEVGRLFRRRFEDEARLHGFTLPQWRALAEISRNEGIAQVALAAAVDTDPMTLSGVLMRLEKRGLIGRYPDPNDSRAKLARLTPEGVALVATARDVGRTLHDQALTGLDAEARTAMAAGLRRIRDNLNSMTAEQREAV